MKYHKIFLSYIKEFFVKYPAVLSGYIIYSYLFVSIVRLFLKVKFADATLSDAYDIFSALPFMWLLAVSLVKVIEYRTKLHESETLWATKERELRLKEAKLQTMHEVVKGLQHQVNNPLAVITLLIGRTKRTLKDNPGAIRDIESIEEYANNITQALKDFTAAQQYEVEHVGEVVGTIAVPPKEQTEKRNNKETDSSLQSSPV
jgi:hypothetical protein